jgi:large subunit ribosomal protein L22
MLYKAYSKFVRISPYKLRPIADVIRGDTVQNALAWLNTHAVKRVKPIEKTLYSAYSNAKYADQKISMNDILVKEIRIDQGPIFKYFKPAAKGSASMQRKRLSHIAIILEKKTA